jgi:nitrite reductase/ring-hydroxylating ferredoxin subunit
MACSSLTYAGYSIDITGKPNGDFNQTSRGTPGGEYLRRFWQPVAYIREIENAPLRVRILAEDLVVFRDRSGSVGVLHLHCSHRGTSLEFGRVEQHGIRCCYHGRVFGVDGSVLEMPGEPEADRLCTRFKQGAYPAHVFGGMVFTYMGPPELMPEFPMYDRFDLPGIRLSPGPRMPFACSWTQVKENAMDPAHTAVLHAWEGRFAAEFGKFPEITWRTTPVGMAYFAARRIDDCIWVRSVDMMCPNIHSISSILEDGRTPKEYSPPWITIWTVPVDDESCINFVLCHVSEDDPTPDEVRNQLMLDNGGQTPHRPYPDRQRVPGDYDAIVSQGTTRRHSLEQLGALDKGVVMFRRQLRDGIRQVQAGQDPHGLCRQTGVLATYGTDRVVRVGEVQENGGLLAVAMETAASYARKPPLRDKSFIGAGKPGSSDAALEATNNEGTS